jgi:hypothetical protein
MCRGSTGYLTPLVVEKTICGPLKINEEMSVKNSPETTNSHFSNVVAHFEKRFLDTYTSSDKKVCVTIALHPVIKLIVFPYSFQQCSETLENC